MENLIPLISDLTDTLKNGLLSVEAFAVALGPGSFSGIRVGLATVKGLALVLRKPVVGISSLEVLAGDALSTGQLGVAVIDARRREVYAAVYLKKTDHLVLRGGPALIPRDALGQFTGKVQGRLVVCGDAVIDDFLDSGPNLVPSPVKEASASTLAKMAWERVRKGQADDLHALAPIYIRRSDAEEKRAPRRPR